jgi:glycosyltransferase involved in cell wall biosynthesis
VTPKPATPAAPEAPASIAETAAEPAPAKPVATHPAPPAVAPAPEPEPAPVPEPPPPLPSPERLRDILWDIGTRFPPPFTSELMAIGIVHPRLGYLTWHVGEQAVEDLKSRVGHDRFHHAALVVRVYDVTDVIWNGFNHHAMFDVPVHALHGTHYLPIERLERALMAEVGFRLSDDSFQALARSPARWFDRNRPSGRFALGGLYVGRDYQRVFPIENVMDAPVYERLNYELQDYRRSEPLKVALVHVGIGPDDGRLDRLVDRLAEKCSKMAVRAEHFGREHVGDGADGGSIDETVERRCARVFAALDRRHRVSAFDMVHCHEWYSVPAGLTAAQTLGLPVLLTLHSTEEERSHGRAREGDSAVIFEWEKRGIRAAALVAVPHASTWHQLVSVYGADAEKVVIIPDVFEDPQSSLPDAGDARRRLHLNPDWPVVLFAGEVSHASGADLFIAAVNHIARNRGDVQFVIVGDGPLKGELEGGIHQAGLGDRVRFLGPVGGDFFEQVMIASDFVALPARTWHDEGLAQYAISLGKPVLTTHQAHIHCIQHGQNGLLTYDNPGSIIWGVQELLSNPLSGNMLRWLARQRSGHTQSVESVAAEYYLAYEKTVAGGSTPRHG